MFLNKISVVSYTVRILLFFVLKEGWRKNISISAPHIAPVVRPCLYGVSRKIQIVLCTGINKAGYIDFIIVAAAILYITGIRAVAAVAWVWCILLYVRGTLPAHIVAGSVMFGIACVCTSLIALVASIARQARGSYTMAEKGKWTGLVLTMGSLAFVLGLILIFAYWDHSINFVGFVLIGLALICWSISSKVILLAKIWHADFPLANRIPIIPVLTALACLFLAAFLYEEAAFQAKFFVPARVLSGFGAICFTLYSIVSILESGASKK